MHQAPEGDDLPGSGGRAGAERLTAALRRTEAGFRTFIDRCPDAVFVRRGETIIHANDALLRLLGRERDEVIGTDPADSFVHPLHRAALRGHRVQEPDGTDLRDVRWVRKDGELVDMEIVGVTVEFEGRPARICMCRDLTERKRMQYKLLVAGHLASIGTLAAGIAQELNTPLAYIISSLRSINKDLQAGSGSPAEVRDALGDVVERAERVLRTVDGLRTFARGDEGRKERLELQGVVDSALQLASTEIRSRAMLVKDYQAVGRVHASESRLVQVFVHLLVNAAHAIPEGHADRNEIRVEIRPDGPTRARVAIRDTGVGIPPERMACIFDPFFKAAGEGAGLGLSICHNVVAGLGGELTVNSRLGSGSTFTVVLPIAAPQVRSGR